MASKPWDQEMASDEDVRRRKLSRRNRGSISTSGLAKNASLRISPLPRESRRHFDVWQCQCATPRPTSVVGLSGFPGSPRSSVGYRSANWTRNPISARLAPTCAHTAVRQPFGRQPFAAAAWSGAVRAATDARTGPHSETTPLMVHGHCLLCRCSTRSADPDTLLGGPRRR